MNIALVGTGQTGSVVEALARERGHVVAARFNSARPLLGEASAEGFVGIDAVIDFSLPALALAHIERYCVWNVPAVIGTTGWYHDRGRVEALVQQHDAAVLYAPNFSIGVALLMHALKSVAPLIDKLPEYDAYVHEVHHRRKLDSPSGTALLLADALIEHLSAKTHITAEAQHERIAPDALHVSSTRAGHVVGHHTVCFDGPFDTLQFVHDARNRNGFAHGALVAAEWLPGRRGLFTLNDMLQTA
ncbi:MAG: 4-hydroxy-tetrahydrodipicolinate reductase [Rhodothermales bacterium]